MCTTAGRAGGWWRGGVALLLAWLVLAALPALAAAPDAAPQIRAVDADWRDALPRDPAAATQAWLDRISPMARAKSDAYFEGGYWLELWNWLAGTAAALLLLATRASARWREFAERTTRFRLLQTLLYGAGYLLALWLLTLPLTVYQEFVREHQYGLATQGFGAWFGEQAMSLAITLAIGSLVIAVLYGAIRRTGAMWWLWGAVLGVVFMALAMVVAPVYIQPLFNTYKPLEDGPVKASLLAMARANGVPASDILEFDASRQTSRVSANVSGLFGTAAIRLNDNLLRRSPPEAIRAVTGHEMGHYVLNHGIKMIIEFGLVLVAGLAATHALFGAVLRRHGAAWGVHGLADPAGLPLVAVLLSGVMLLATPVTNTIVRSHEVEADLFGLNAAREPDGMAEALLTLVAYRKADPGPIEEFVFFDHPGTRSRIFAAMRWKAENQR